MKKIWFKRKTYGWGWTPVSWQGWLSTVVYAVVLLWLFRVVDSLSHSMSDVLVGFAPAFIFTTLVFVAVCWVTGEESRFQRDDTSSVQNPVPPRSTD